MIEIKVGKPYWLTPGSCTYCWNHAWTRWWRGVHAWTEMCWSCFGTNSLNLSRLLPAAAARARSTQFLTWKSLLLSNTGLLARLWAYEWCEITCKNYPILVGNDFPTWSPDLDTDGKKPSNHPLLFHFWRGGGNNHPFFLEGKNEGNVPAKGSLTCQKPLPRNYCNFWLARA